MRATEKLRPEPERTVKPPATQRNLDDHLADGDQARYALSQRRARIVSITWVGATSRR